MRGRQCRSTQPDSDADRALAPGACCSGATWNSSYPLDDLWVFSLGNRTWREVQQQGSRPAARWLYSTTEVDLPVGGGRRVLLFGGAALRPEPGRPSSLCPSIYYNDIWALDPDRGFQWTRLAESRCPRQGPEEHMDDY